MTSPARDLLRLAALAAAFAPAAAPRLLGLAGRDGDARRAAAEAARLATQPRAERLAALAARLAPTRADGAPLAAAERPRVAAAARAIAAGAVPADVSPVLVRLVLERLAAG